MMNRKEILVSTDYASLTPPYRAMLFYLAGSRQGGDANSVRLKHDETSWQTLAMVADQRDDAAAECGTCGDRIADENDAASGMPRRIDELPEVLVLGEQKTTFP